MKPSCLFALVFAVLTVALGIAASPAKGADDKDDALAEIKKLGGTVVKFPFSVSFDGKGVTDEALDHLAKLPDLEAIYLRKCKVTDKGMEKLAKLTKLKYLYLNDTEVGDKGLEQLKGLSKLESFGLMNTQVTDEGLAHLKGLSALKVLEIKGSKVTDTGVAELKKTFPKLVVR